MKIDRFNENTKNWTKEKLKINIEDNTFLIEKLTDYLLYKDENIIEDLGDFYIRDYYFGYNENIFFIDYVNGFESGYQNFDQYYVRDIDELINFINNSDMFKKSKKYNI